MRYSNNFSISIFQFCTIKFYIKLKTMYHLQHFVLDRLRVKPGRPTRKANLEGEIWLSRLDCN